MCRHPWRVLETLGKGNLASKLGKVLKPLKFGHKYKCNLFYPQACEAQGTFGNKNIKVQKINFKGKVYSLSSAGQTIYDALSTQLVK